MPFGLESKKMGKFSSGGGHGAPWGEAEVFCLLMWAGQMAEWVKALAMKCEPLSLNPQNPHRSQEQ